MKTRCSNRNRQRAQNYVGRGIAVCDEWQKYEPFRDHILSLLPEGSTDVPKHLSIDRIDNDGNYEPGNVRLATMSEQAGNRRSSVIVEIDGVKRCLKEWATRLGHNYQMVQRRIRKYGWDPVRALTTPSRVGRRIPNGGDGG